nr:spaetzle-processing enzyme [Drosophila takahashii]
MLLNRLCDVDHSKRSLAQRIYVKCPKPVSVCQSNESCVGLNNCPQIHDIANNPSYKLRLCQTNARRSYYDHQTYICCPEAGNILPDGFKMQCGQTQGSYRIANGRKANLNQFPWMAMLLYRNILRYSSQTLFTVCGGSLINKRYVLTAAHCVNKSVLKSKELKRVRLGEHDIDSFGDCSDGKCAPPHLEMGIQKVISHENFDSRTYANDIALLRLELPVRYTKEIQPICLLRDHIALRNQRLEIAGWGKMENESFSHNVWDTCEGDSGGPLMATYKIKSTFKEFVFLAGITSFGLAKSCGQKNNPAAYTKTGVYFQWIQSNLNP